MTAAIPSHGTLLQKGNGAGPEVFTTIAEVVEITPPALKRESIDATSHSSANAWHEKLKGLKDAGQVTFSINYQPANATHGVGVGGLLGDFSNDSTISNWKLIFTDSGPTAWVFPGFVTSFAPKAPLNGRLTADVTIEISGMPTLA
jgi:predicted secreted protein